VTDQDPGAETLDVPTAQAAVLTVMRLFRALERIDTGLTAQQYRILKLAGAGGERSARLAERLAVAKPTLTATADGLVAAGYAQREAEPGDRRVVRLCLTAAGRAALERADVAYTGWLGPLLGVTEVHAAGGAQALAMFAYGTSDCPPVDVITGPGNVYVAAAKRVLRGVVGTDGEAGPTEVAIIADDTANPVHVAADLVAQAEHDELAACLLITSDADLAGRVDAELATAQASATKDQAVNDEMIKSTQTLSQEMQRNSGGN